MHIFCRVPLQQARNWRLDRGAERERELEKATAKYQSLLRLVHAAERRGALAALRFERRGEP